MANGGAAGRRNPQHAAQPLAFRERIAYYAAYYAAPSNPPQTRFALIPTPLRTHAPTLQAHTPASFGRICLLRPSPPPAPITGCLGRRAPSRKAVWECTAPMCMPGAWLVHCGCLGVIDAREPWAREGGHGCGCIKNGLPSRSCTLKVSECDSWDLNPPGEARLVRLQSCKGRSQGAEP